MIEYLKKRFNVEYVDSITEAGPNKILAEGKDKTAIRSIFEKVKISITKHASTKLAVTGHYDCAGNPASRDEQISQVKICMLMFREKYKNIEIIGLWIDNNWKVEEIN